MTNRRNKANIIIGGKDYSRYLVFPFVMQDTGTEQLDSAIVTLRNLPTEDKFPPFTEVSLCGGKYTYVIADDRVTEVFGRSLWHHEITLIDETKTLERILMEGKSFTQPLIQYNTTAKDADCYRFIYNVGGTDTVDAKTNLLKTPIYATDGNADITIPSPKTMVDLLGGLYDGKWTVSLLYSKGAVAFESTDGGFEIIREYQTSPDGELNNEYTETVSVKKTGVYTIRYIVTFEGIVGSAPENRYYIPLAVYNQVDAPKKYSVYDVMQITLETAEPIFKGDTPRYSLQLTEEQEARYKAMDAPEMHFANGRSLYENLKEIGDYIHALPKAKGGKIYWQELGSAERADLSKGRQYGASSDYNAADYASAIEANFANLINSSDEAEGSVTDPYTDGFITLRSNSYRIKEEDSYIPTNFPIGTKIKQVLVRIHDDEGNVTKTVDITPAVFEKNEYDLLSSFTGIYPFSKTHALFYTTGQKNIEGLWYRVQDSALSFMNQFQRYAITNVINFFGGTNYGVGDIKYTNLSFQVTYIPIINGRARQERTESTVERVILAHNQSANQLSAKAFGENLRGKVAMLGNSTDAKMYIFPYLDDIPKAGTMYDRKEFISLVTTRVFPDYCLSKIDLSTNYNNQGAFAQMKTGIRQYEIPAGQDRCTLIEEFCVIGKDEHIPREQGMLCQNVMCEKTMKAFYFTNLNAEDITSAFITTWDENSEPISGTVALPVYSTSLGASVYFGFSFSDNYSAGKKSIDAGLSNARGTEYVEYGSSVYAKAKYLSFAFTNKYLVTDLLAASNDLPNIDSSAVYDAETVYITTESDNGALDLVWNKDGADIGNVAYQLHFVSNDGYIIGSELAKMMPYIRTSGQYKEVPKVYFYETEIDELTGKSHSEPIAESELDAGWQQSYFLRIMEMPTTAYKSFVIKRPNGECIIGKNTENANQVIHFNFKRRR